MILDFVPTIIIKLLIDWTSINQVTYSWKGKASSNSS